MDEVTGESPRRSDVEQDTVAAPVRHEGRKGFLPFTTNTWDRFFISVVCFVAISLLWLRFVEAYLPLWGAVLLSAVLGFFIITRG